MLKFHIGIIGEASKDEFLQGEKIIEKVISEINPEWSIIQKLAYVHYKMGELISYVPDFNFQNINGSINVARASRNIWNSLSNNKSVCNGVTSIQRNILSRLGIETEELSSGSHSFMLTKTEKGNIITDATWDLRNTLYKAKPTHFGVSYEELRKREEGISNAHKLENPPENVIEISDEELRDIYQSIGIIDSSRKFPLPILSKVEEYNRMSFDTKKDKLDAFLSMFTQIFSKEATHLQETRDMLEQAISELGVNRNQIESKFLYSKEDDDCAKSILTFHIKTDELQDIVKMFNPDKMSFDEIDLKTLDENYKVHDFDTVEPFWKSYLKENTKEIQQERE